MADGHGARALPFERPLGACPVDGGRVEFRVWAPRAGSVSVVLEGDEHPLGPAGYGVFEGILACGVGVDYRYALDGGQPLPDPCSRWQPGGVLGASRVLEPASFEWTDADWSGYRLDPASVLYELHVGTFSPEGTFDGVIPRLPELVGLGVEAIELLPIATFPGERNWGYDGLYLWAAHPAYGGPAGFARLVDAAHSLGLAVLLDVVYNHVGPGAEALAAFGPYFSDRYRTPWGDAINYDDAGCGAVREWAIQSACSWVRDFHVDGLRLDAVHAIYDSSPIRLTCELTARVRGCVDRDVVLIAETDRNDPATTQPCQAGGQGFDAQWADDLHHALHAAITGERDGYYEDYGSIEDVVRGLSRPFVYEGRYSPFLDRRRGAPVAADPRLDAFVVASQNHDQVGNRALGDRLAGAHGRLAAFCVLLSPWTAMLFMGQEYGEERPFQFFTDHIDPDIAEATRQGRRREFARFVSFAGEVPDPQAPETMERSRLDPRAGDASTRDLYRRLIELRRELAGQAIADPRVDAEAGVLQLRRGQLGLHANFSFEQRELATSGAELVLASVRAELSGGILRLGPLCAAAVG